MENLAKNLKSILVVHWQYVPLIASAFILGSPFLFSGKVLFWGTVILQFIPWRHYAWEILQSGQLPLWNPLVGMGAPLLANYQSALLYPPNWILYFLDSLGGVGWLAWGQGLLVVLHWCLAGAGMIGLLKWLGVGKFGQAVGGLSFGLSSYLVGRASFLSINAAVAWLPWIILYSSILVQEVNQRKKPTRRSFLILVILFTLQLLAGHAQTTWYTILLAFIWSGFWSYYLAKATNPSWRNLNILSQISKNWLWMIVSLMVAVMISAPQLFPTFEYLLQSQRSTAVEAEQAMTYSFWQWRFITLFAPGMYGNPATGDYWGYGNYWEDALYIGLLPVILALWMLLRGWKTSHKIKNLTMNNSIKPFIAFLAVLIVITMILALGNRTPIFPWLYHHIPTFDMFQAPTRISIWVIFALTILAGLGIEKLHRPIKRALYWTRLATAGAFAVTLGASLALVVLEDVAPTFIRAFALLGLFGILCGIFVLSAPEVSDDKKPKTKFDIVWTLAVLLFICGDLIFSNWGLNPGIDRAVIERMTTLLPEQAVKDQRLYISAKDEYRLKFDNFMRFDTFSPASGWESLASVQIPNMAMLRSVPSVNNFDPLLPAGFAQWEDTLAEVMESGNAEIAVNMLNLMGVGIVEELNLTTNALVSYRNLENPQRVRLVNCSIHVQNHEQAMALITENKIKVNEEVIIEGIDGDQKKVCLSSNSSDTNNEVEIITENPNYVAIQTGSSNPVWLVLADVWYPGWIVTINGEKTTGYRANSMFRAVQVEAGKHLVEFVYRPFSFYMGLFASIMGILLMVLYKGNPWK